MAAPVAVVTGGRHLSWTLHSVHSLEIEKRMNIFITVLPTHCCGVSEHAVGNNSFPIP